jgi:hypothetical protein
VPTAIALLMDRLRSPHEVVRQAGRDSLSEFRFDRFLANYETLDGSVRRSTGELVKQIDPTALDKVRADLSSPSRLRRLRALELIEAMSAAPELAAHLRTLQRLDIALEAWRRSVAEASPMAQRYQTALLQQAAHAVISCLHVGALSESESARTFVTRNDLGAYATPTPP